MNVHLYQNAKQHEPYPLDQLRAWLLSGQISPTVMAQREGEAGWIPLYCVPQLRDDESLNSVITLASQFGHLLTLS